MFIVQASTIAHNLKILLSSSYILVKLNACELIIVEGVTSKNNQHKKTLTDSSKKPIFKLIIAISHRLGQVRLS